MEGYKRVTEADLHVGDEVILETHHWDYKTGRPIESDFYRTIVDQHKTVAGMAFDLVSVPNLEWPKIPPWMRNRIYAGNDVINTMYVKEGP